MTINNCRSSVACRFQGGAATLVTVVVLIVASISLAFFSARLVLNETKVSANDYRTKQAVEAAMAAIDDGLSGFSQDGEIDASIIASTAHPSLTSCSNLTPIANTRFVASAALPSTVGLYYFANEGALDRCAAAGAVDTGTLYGVGWSDDCEATRRASVCIGVAPLFNNSEGPEQPFVTRAGVGVFGNANVINRYTNISIWAGESAAIAGNAFATYLRPTGIAVSDLTKAELLDNDPANNSQLVSNRNSGFGIDVVFGDQSLANATGDDLWGAFFNPTKVELYDTLPLSRKLSSGASVPSGATGQYWIGDNGAPSTTQTTINGGTIGDIDDPAVLIVNGDLKISGNTVITGLIYVTGELSITGTPTIRGSVISENGPNSGNGTLNLIYAPFGGDGLANPNITNSASVIPGSWRDW